MSGGLDACPDWLFLHRHLMREGAAWVGVSAQKVGIDGGGFVPGMPLKIVNPERYGCLVHPGDAFAFDVYSEVGRALRTAGSGPLGQLKAQRMIAIGESQSAGFMVTYVNAFMNWAMYSTRLSFPQSLSGNPCPPLDARLRIAGMTTEYAAKYVAIFVPRPTIAGPGSAHHVGNGAELDPRQRAADEARRQGTQ